MYVYAYILMETTYEVKSFFLSGLIANNVGP